jgi:hypothetical protein
VGFVRSPAISSAVGSCATAARDSRPLLLACWIGQWAAFGAYLYFPMRGDVVSEDG